MGLSNRNLKLVGGWVRTSLGLALIFAAWVDLELYAARDWHILTLELVKSAIVAFGIWGIHKASKRIFGECSPDVVIRLYETSAALILVVNFMGDGALLGAISGTHHFLLH